MKRTSSVPVVQCVACPATFRPRRARQRHCSPGCRKRAFRRRQRDAQAGREPGAGLRADELLAGLQDYRRLLGAPLLAESPQLSAFALVREAEEQIRRWHQRLAARRQQLDKLSGAADHLTVRVQVLTDGRLPSQPATADTHGAVVATAPDLAVVVTGRRAPLL